MQFKDGFPVPQPEYIEKAKLLPEEEVRKLMELASEGYYDLYQAGIWSKEELLAVKLQQQEGIRAFRAEQAKKFPHLYRAQPSEPSTPPASS